MKLLICCTTPWELKTIKTQIKSLNFNKHLDISYLCTGIGNNETIYSLTNYLTKNKEILDNIILLNIWICWYRGKINKKVLQVWRIKNMITNKEVLVPQILKFWEIENIYFSENNLYTKEQEKDFWYIDKESRAIEFCCDKFKIPRILIKIPYYKIWEEKKDYNEEKALKTLSKDIEYGNLINLLLSKFS